VCVIVLSGVGRSVVLVKDVNSELFEQAIFILTPKGADGYVNDSDEIVKEARKVLSGYTSKYYMEKKKRDRRRGHSRKLYFILAAAIIGFISLLTLLMSM
jgi:hypothetical protein